MTRRVSCCRKSPPVNILTHASIKSGHHNYDIFFFVVRCPSCYQLLSIFQVRDSFLPCVFESAEIQDDMLTENLIIFVLTAFHTVMWNINRYACMCAHVRTHAHTSEMLLVPVILINSENIE